MTTIEISIPTIPNLDREKSGLSTITPSDQVAINNDAATLNNEEEEEEIQRNETSAMEKNRENAFSKVSSRFLNSSFRISSQYNKSGSKMSPPPPPPATDYDFNSVASYIQGDPLTNGFVLTKVNPVLDPDFLYLNRNKLVNRRLILRKNNQSLADFSFENENLIDRPVTEFTLSSSANLNRVWNNNSSMEKTSPNNHFKNIRSYNLEK